MSDDRKETFNPPADTGSAPGTATDHNSPRGLGLDTTLDTSRTGGMGGMAGTMNADTDMAGTAPSGDVEDQ